MEKSHFGINSFVQIMSECTKLWQKIGQRTGCSIMCSCSMYYLPCIIITSIIHIVCVHSYKMEMLESREVIYVRESLPPVPLKLSSYQSCGFLPNKTELNALLLILAFVRPSLQNNWRIHTWHSFVWKKVHRLSLDKLWCAICKYAMLSRDIKWSLINPTLYVRCLWEQWERQ